MPESVYTAGELDAVLAGTRAVLDRHAGLLAHLATMLQDLQGRVAKLEGR